MSNLKCDQFSIKGSQIALNDMSKKQQIASSVAESLDGQNLGG